MNTLIGRLIFWFGAAVYSGCSVQVNWSVETSETAGAAEEISSTLRVFSENREVPLAAGSEEPIRRSLIALLESSNFSSNETGDTRIFDRSGVQQDYRDVVATGEYLVLRFSAPREISTVAGDETVIEIVAGLKSPGGRNSVFSVEPSGAIVSHAKYAGELYVELKKAVAAARK